MSHIWSLPYSAAATSFTRRLQAPKAAATAAALAAAQEKKERATILAPDNETVLDFVAMNADLLHITPPGEEVYQTLPCSKRSRKRTTSALLNRS